MELLSMKANQGTTYIRKGDCALKIHRTGSGTFIEAIRFYGEHKSTEYLWSPMSNGLPRIFKLTGRHVDAKVPLLDVLRRQQKFPDKAKVRLRK